MAVERDDIRALTTEGQARIEKFEAEYHIDLLTHAQSIARRFDAPSVGARYVDLAAAELFVKGRASRSEEQSLAVGSLFGGGALSGLITFVATADPPPALAVSTAVLGVLAAWFLGRWRSLSKR